MIWIVKLFLIGGLAGVMNSMVGGGSMLTVPALILIGSFSEQQAVGSNRFVLVFMTLTSSIRYWQLDKLQTVCLKQMLPGVIPGAFLGAMIVGRINQSILSTTIGVITLVLLSLLFVDPDRGEEAQAPLNTWWSLPVIVTCSFLLGIYGGFYGAGVSTLLCFTMIYLLGRTMVQGIGTAQVLTFFISLAASVRFAMDGYILYTQVIPLGVGLVAGAYVGPRIAVTFGNRYIKIVFSIIVSIAALKLIFPGVLPF